MINQDTPPDFPKSETDWNYSQFKWWPYLEGMAQAKNHDLDVIFVSHASRCGTCERAARSFHNPKIVKGIKYFVMILTDVDLEKGAARKLS